MNEAHSNPAPARASNPFANGAAIQQSNQGGALTEVAVGREVAEVQAAMAIAKRFPRDPIAAMDRILQACTRPTLAEGALYSYSRGGSSITGPSIRLAEVAAQCWGNLQFGIRELEQRKGESTVEAFAWDIETNTRQTKVFQVSHKRHTRKGSYKLEDPRDIYELVANQGARRLRACILGVIPGDVIEAAVAQCETTLHAHADVSPEGIRKLVAAFEGFGVKKAQLEKWAQVRMDAIRPAQVVRLRSIYGSIKDGMSSPGDWFEVDATAAPATAETLKDKVAKRTSKKKGKTSAKTKAEAPEPAPAPVEPDPADAHAESGCAADPADTSAEESWK
jgi:hypothetical protein